MQLLMHDIVEAQQKLNFYNIHEQCIGMNFLL